MFNLPRFKTPTRPTESHVLRVTKQFLVHSYIYYKLDDSIIDDSMYDEICKELFSYKPYVKQYKDLIDPLDESGSGFYILDYPPEIRTVAHQLHYKNLVRLGKRPYQLGIPNTYNQSMSDYERYLARYGLFLL
ncbi:MAG: DNA ligase LigA-related protein [Bacilli bacterium]